MALAQPSGLFATSSDEEKMENIVNKEEEELNLALGYRFSPHGHELIVHYLVRKILGQQLPVNIIRDIDLYAYDPHQLPVSEFKYGKPKEAYFFTHLENREEEERQQRSTNNGYWKASGRDEEIFYGETLVGWKKSFIFYEGKAPTGSKSRWVMHEFRANPLYIPADAQDETIKTKIEKYVVCKIKCKEESDNKRNRRNLPSEGEDTNKSEANQNSQHCPEAKPEFL